MNLKIRKILLLSGIAVLLCIFIIQTVNSSRETSKTFTIKDEITELTIKNADETINLKKSGEKWFLGEKNYPAAESIVDDMIESISKINTLDKIVNGANDVTLERYELDSEKEILIEAKSTENVLRTLHLGKTSSAGSQTYVKIDDSNDIYIAGGNLRNTFDKESDLIRSRVVMTLNKDEISSIFINDYENSQNYTVSRSGSGENLVWNLSGAEGEIDSEKASDWFGGFASISTPVWYDEDEVNSLSGQKIVDAEIVSENKKVTFTIYKIPGKITTDENGEETQESDTYYATSSETPYTFELGGYNVVKFQKPVSELIK